MERQIEIRDIIAPEPKSIYLAGPFFNEPQIKTLERIETLCEQFGVKCNSPRKFLVLKPHASWEERKLVFRDNLLKMQMSEIILACLDNPHVETYEDGAPKLDIAPTPRPPDTGTLWEMGYAYAIGRPVLPFTVGSKKMNVMLAQGCAGFLQSIGDVSAFLEGLKCEDPVCGKPEWDFNWEVAESWQKEIY